MLSVSVLISLLVFLLIVALIAGLAVFLIRRAPFIPAEFKAWAEYAVIAIAVLIIIVKLLNLLGVAA